MAARRTPSTSDAETSSATAGRGKGQVGAQLAIDLGAERKRRTRFPDSLPKPPEVVEFPYAKAHAENFDAGEEVAWMIAQPEWEQTIGAECDLVEAERPRKGPKPSYSTRELEVALFFGVVEGIRTYRSTRDRLAGDRGRRARVALGFDQPRERRCPAEAELLGGVPSEATISRHRARFPFERRLDAYQRYFDLLRIKNVQQPALQDGLRILGIDGSAQLTSFTCPKLKNDGSGEIVNAAEITCPEGGYVGKNAPPEKQGHGFAATILHDINGLPWEYQHGRIQMSERDAALKIIDDFKRTLRPHMSDRAVAVLTADSNFHSRELRAAVKGLDIVENIHDKSHAKHRPTTDDEVAKADAAVLDIDGYPNWHANGHRELRCRCGKASIGKDIGLDGSGAYARVTGKCTSCGRVKFTAGEYKTVRDTTRTKGDPRGAQRLVKVQPGDPSEVIDWQFGNPLSFNDLVAARYGDMRFGHGEGFNGTMVKRFKLLKTKGYYRTKAQAELHCVMVFSAIHALTMRQLDRAVVPLASPASALPAAA